MDPQYHWQLPTYGDGRNVVNANSLRAGRTSAGGDPLRRNVRQADVYYLVGLARAAEQAGFSAVLLPTGFSTEETFVTTAAVAPQTRSLEYIVAFTAGLTLPAITAQQTATLQRVTGNRVRLNITTGGSPEDQRAYGDFLAKDDRYRRTDEFLTVLEKLWAGKEFSHKGEFFRNEVTRIPDFGPRPPVYFAGSSEIAKDVAARHADVYLMYGEPPPVIRSRVAEMRERAASYGRELRFGIFMYVISRDTEAEARAEAARHLESMDPDLVAKVQAELGKMDSVGQARISGLHSGLASGGTVGGVGDLLVYPNVWAGIGLARGGGGTALLGSYGQVAERIEEYHDAGLDTLILSGYPALEEAFRVGELVLPRVGR